MMMPTPSEKPALALLAPSATLRPLAGLLAVLTACGSPNTIDSADVPNKPQPQSESAVPDIHQDYLATYSAQTGRTHALAQFRVHSQYGDSIRFSHSDQVRFGGVAMDKLDGDPARRDPVHQLVLILVPVLALIRTGTSYKLSLPGRHSGPFAFVDDYGHAVTVPATIPELVLPESLPPPPQGSQGTGPQQPYSISFTSRETPDGQDATTTGKGLDRTARCTLMTTVRSSADGQERLHTASAAASFSGDKGTCTFGPEASPSDPASGPTTLRVEGTVQTTKRDSWERDFTARFSHVAERKL